MRKREGVELRIKEIMGTLRQCGDWGCLSSRVYFPLVGRLGPQGSRPCESQCRTVARTARGGPARSAQAPGGTESAQPVHDNLAEGRGCREPSNRRRAKRQASALDAQKDADSQASAEKSPPSVGRPTEGHGGWVNRDTSPACG